jgi:hypothetical protein
MVGEQVDLVDVEQAAVGPAEHPLLYAVLSGEGRPEVERSDEPVERRSEGELDERRRAGSGGVAEDRREGADGGRLGGAPLPADQYAADDRMDGADEQRLDEVVLADDRRQRIRPPSAGHPGVGRRGGMLAAHAVASSSWSSSAR